MAEAKKHPGLYEKVDECIQQLACSPACLLDLQEDLLAIQLDKHILHISLPCWVSEEGGEQPCGEECFVVTTPTADDTSGELEGILVAANERGQRITAGPDAVTDMVKLLGKLIAAKGDAGSNGEAGSENEYHDEEDEDSDDNMLLEDDGDSVGLYFEDEAMVSSKSALHLRAEAADRMCCEARARDGKTASSSSSSTLSLLDSSMNPREALQWCSVQPRPLEQSVCLEFKIGSIIADSRAADLLEFSLKSPMRVKLKYGASQWSSEERGLVPDNIVVSEVYDLPGQLRYGPQTLLKDMVRNHFLENKNGRKRKQGDDPATSDNEFVDVMLAVLERLQKLCWSCIICHEPFPSASWRIRPCSKEFCLFKFEEIGLGASTLHQLKESSDVVKVELTFALAAARSAAVDVFEPYPSFLLKDQEIRPRSGFFGQSAELYHANAATADAAGMATCVGLQPKPPPSSNKQLTALSYVFDKLPPINSMAACATEKELTEHINEHLLAEGRKMEARYPGYSCMEAPEEVLRRGYDIFRFVLSSNQLHLRPVPSQDWLDIPNTIAQIAVLSDSPDREGSFLAKTQQAGAVPSTFAFHGSSLENWFSIMRNGLRSLSKTRYMRAGNAHGDGVYLSTFLSMSLNYSGYGEGWGDLARKNVSAVGIVEVAPYPCSNTTMNLSPHVVRGQSHGILVVPKEHEAGLLIRYILLFDSPSAAARAQNVAIITNGAHLGDVDLRAHFRNQREAYQQGQRSELESRRKLGRQLSASADNIAEELPQPAPSGLGSGTEVELLSISGETLPFTTPGGISIKPTVSATSAIQREYRTLSKLQRNGSPSSSLPGGSFSVDIPEENNIYRWQLTLRPCLFPDSLQAELRTHASRKAGLASQTATEGTPVVMEMIFSGDFPFKPPFLRVISPLFAFRTGHVTVGGSICMELLTESGWSAAYSLESMIVQVINAMSEGKAHIDLSRVNDRYSEREARDAFLRVARQHDWKV